MSDLFWIRAQIWYQIVLWPWRRCLQLWPSSLLWKYKGDQWEHCDCNSLRWSIQLCKLGWNPCHWSCKQASYMGYSQWLLFRPSFSSSPTLWPLPYRLIIVGLDKRNLSRLSASLTWIYLFRCNKISFFTYIIVTSFCNIIEKMS